MSLDEGLALWVPVHVDFVATGPISGVEEGLAWTQCSMMRDYVRPRLRFLKAVP